MKKDFMTEERSHFKNLRYWFKPDCSYNINRFLFYFESFQCWMKSGIYSVKLMTFNIFFAPLSLFNVRKLTENTRTVEIVSNVMYWSSVIFRRKKEVPTELYVSDHYAKCVYSLLKYHSSSVSNFVLTVFVWSRKKNWWRAIPLQLNLKDTMIWLVLLILRHLLRIISFHSNCQQTQ